jgi:hypothetical protein
MANSTEGPSGHATWREFYQAAMLELDNARLSRRIVDARNAILDRSEEILTLSSDHERRALNDALRSLHVLEEVAAREKAAA